MSKKWLWIELFHFWWVILHTLRTLYDFLQMRLREFRNWFQLSRNLAIKNQALPVGREWRGGDEAMRRGEVAAMATSITSVSENNGQIMTVKVVNVSAAAAVCLLFPSNRMRV